MANKTKAWVITGIIVGIVLVILSVFVIKPLVISDLVKSDITSQITNSSLNKYIPTILTSGYYNSNVTLVVSKEFDDLTNTEMCDSLQVLNDKITTFVIKRVGSNVDYHQLVESNKITVISPKGDYKYKYNKLTLNDELVDRSAPINVTVQVTPSTTSDGKTKFLINTNLPDDTIMMISLKSSTTSYHAQDQTSVYAGQAESAKFSKNNLPLAPGNYVIQVTTSRESLQPSSVQYVIGDMGINLKGLNISDDPKFGKTVNFATNVTIP